MVFKKKQAAVDEQIAEIDKLNAVINAAERDMLKLRKVPSPAALLQDEVYHSCQTSRVSMACVICTSSCQPVHFFMSAYAPLHVSLCISSCQLLHQSHHALLSTHKPGHSIFCKQ